MNKIQFDKLLKPLVAIYDEIEIDLIINLLNRLENYKGVQGSLEWYLDKIAETGILDKENLEVFKQNKSKVKAVLEELLTNASNNTDNFEMLDNYYKNGLINTNPLDIYNSVSINTLLNDALKDSETIMDLINTKAIEGASESYKHILNKAYIETATGVYTYNESIKKALEEFAETGIRAVHYKSGKTLDIESAVRRDVITRVNKLVGDIEIQHCKELDTNLVYVDQHLGARVRTKYTEHDYEAHAEWQGKKYMIDGSNDKFDNLYEKTGYGEMLGLKGINCYHNIRPTWEWEEIPPIIDEEENKEKYESFQLMRSYERNIRKLKRQNVVFEKTNDTEKLIKTKEKLKIRNKQYNSFLKTNGLDRDYSKEYVVLDNINLFQDNIVDRDFKNLDKTVEHLKVYDLKSNKLIYEVCNNDKNHVGGKAAKKVFKKSKPNSLVAVHNHPSNSSFSTRDIITFNSFKSIDLIVVKTDKYLYYLEKNGISKIKNKLIEKEYPKLYNEYCKIYGKNIETRHLVNKKFAEKVGWNYGRK